MYEFLDRLISIALPRVRDFRGLSPKFDGRGNYNLGVKEQIIFPEIDYDKIDVLSEDLIFLFLHPQKMTQMRGVYFWDLIFL